MLLTSQVPENLLHMSLGNSGILFVLGLVVIFLGIALLMAVVKLMGMLFSRKKEKKQEPVAVEAAPAAAPATAPGTAGELKLHNVPPKTAAMIMAIVANKLDKPLNELRFISIKEVE